MEDTTRSFSKLISDLGLRPLHCRDSARPSSRVKHILDFIDCGTHLNSWGADAALTTQRRREKVWESELKADTAHWPSAFRQINCGEQESACAVDGETTGDVREQGLNRCKPLASDSRVSSTGNAMVIIDLEPKMITIGKLTKL